MIISCASYLTRHSYGLLDAQNHPGQKHSTGLGKTGSVELLLTDKPVSDQKPSLVPILPHGKLHPLLGRHVL